MIYTAIDNFYLTDEQLKDSPSRKDGIDEATETTLRIYGCDLIQESGILLRLYPASVLFYLLVLFRLLQFTFYFWVLSFNFLVSYAVCWFHQSFVSFNHIVYRPQAVMATGQVLFHRFYCKKSFARFDVKVSSPCWVICTKQKEREDFWLICVFVYLILIYVRWTWWFCLKI